MKQILFSLVAFSSIVIFAQEAAVQSGTPALLEASNGKKAKVMLQSFEDGNLTFQPFKSTKNMTVPASKITNLQFFPKYDVEGAKQSFSEADYVVVLSILEPVMAEFSVYMPIQNNLQDTFCMMFDSYRGKGDFSNVRKTADLLLESNNPEFITKAKVGLALAALDEKDFSTAEKIQEELESPAAALYLKASIERAQDNPKQAIQTVSIIIADHANDLEWLPKSELLNAYLYLDMTGTNSIITTNSAINTARQVKNMYGGSHVAGDARKLWASLGGEKIEAEENLAKAERAAAVKKAKADREASKLRERKNREAAAVRKKAAAEMAASTNLTTTTEMESE